MNFSEALEYIKAGGRLTRTGWRVQSASINLVDNRFDKNLAYIELHTISGNVSYTATSPDLLANDWEIVS